jgi:hypothetical protein
VCFVDLTKTLLVNVRDVQTARGYVAVKTERRVGCRIGKSTTERGRLRENGDGMTEGLRWAGQGRFGKKYTGRWEQNVDGRLGGVNIGRRGGGSDIDSLHDWGRHRGGHDGGVNRGISAGGCNRVGPLAAVTPVRELMIVEATGQLSLFQVSGNVLVWHFLETSLKEINFLREKCERNFKSNEIH